MTKRKLPDLPSEPGEINEEDIIPKYGTRVTRPILSPALDARIADAIAQYTHRTKWEEWGLHTIRPMGASILLEGPSGTGKTTIARYLCRKLRKGFKDVSLANFGGESPGATEKNLSDIFDDGARRKNMTLFFDECDHVLRDRSHISGDALTWMVSTTETLMTKMDQYKGLVILATNMPQVLDPAIFRRLLAVIKIDPPGYDERVRLWEQKIPAKFPLRLSTAQIATLAKTALTGAEIENAIIGYASHAIRSNTRPSFAGLQGAAKTYHRDTRSGT